MRKWIGTASLILLAAWGVLLLSGCDLAPQPPEGAERDTILASTEPVTDNMLAGLQTGDYAQFSRDMDPQMLKSMSEAQFDGLKTMLDAKIGSYVSRQVSQVDQQGNLTTVSYTARFEDEESVAMRVVFDQNWRIAGLWFDSPKLRQQ